MDPREEFNNMQRKSREASLDGYNFYHKSLDWDALNADLHNVQWKQEMVELDVDQKLSYFMRTVWRW